MPQASACLNLSTRLRRRHRRRRLVVAAVAAALVVTLGACSNSSATDATAGGYVSGDGSITFVPPSERVAAPVLEGTDLDGAPLTSGQFSDQVLVVNIWGSWCPPCRKETPDLISLAEEFSSQGVQFLGVAIRENATASRAFAENFGMNYPSFSDSGGVMLIGFSESLPTVAVPTTYILDARGRVAVRYMDQVDPDMLRDLITDVKEGR